MPDGRPTIATADNRGSLAIGGLMQFDMGGYFQNPNPQFPQLNDGVNLRRGRTRFRRAKGATEDYFASAYLTGPDFGDQDGALLNGEQVGFVLRLAGRPYHDEDWNLHAGLSGRTVFHPNINANGAPGVSRTTISLGDQPELRIDFNKLVSTGTLSANGASVYGGELAIGWRNLLVQGEYYQLGVTQAKLPNVPAPRLGFNGGYVEGGWVLTGEPIPTIPRGRPGVGQRSTARSASPMAGSALGSLSARYSTVSLSESVTGGICVEKLAARAQAAW